MKHLLTALVCLVGIAGIALAAPASATNPDAQMKNLMQHTNTRGEAPLPQCF